MALARPHRIEKTLEYELFASDENRPNQQRDKAYLAV